MRDLGSYRLKDIDHFERLYQLDIEGLASDFPPLNAERVAERRPRRRMLLGGLVALAALVAVAAAALLSRAGGAPTVAPESLVKIDADTNEIVDVIPVGRSPREVEVVGDYAFVASEADGTLTRVDSRTGAVTNSGQYDASDSLAGEGEEWLWVTSVGRQQVTRVDVALPKIDVTERVEGPRVPLPTNLGSTALAVGGGSLWVAETDAVERWHLHPLRREPTYPLSPTTSAAASRSATGPRGARSARIPAPCFASTRRAGGRPASRSATFRTDAPRSALAPSGWRCSTTTRSGVSTQSPAGRRKSSRWEQGPGVSPSARVRSGSRTNVTGRCPALTPTPIRSSRRSRPAINRGGSRPGAIPFGLASPIDEGVVEDCA